VLLAGRSGKSLHSMAEFLRVNTYQVVTATRNVEDVLRAGTWPFDGVIVQVEPKETEHLELVSSLRKAGLPIILQVVGRNQDEIDTQVLAKADLVLTADLSRDAILERLSALFARQKARGA
jgi:DNA-binding response OmpR family regulator